MKKTLAKYFMIVVAAALIPGISFAAGNGNQTGDQDGTPDQDRNRDGSCQAAVYTLDNKPLVVANGNQTGDQDGTPDQDRSRDGSCQEG